jgi:Caspase domain
VPDSKAASGAGCCFLGDSVALGRSACMTGSGREDAGLGQISLSRGGSRAARGAACYFMAMPSSLRQCALVGAGPPGEKLSGWLRWSRSWPMPGDRSASRAILIGNGTFSDPAGLPPLPAVGCVTAMAGLLASDLCGWSQDRIDVITDAETPSALALRVLQSVRDADGTLLVYYAGHGMRTRDGELALALRGTVADPEALPHTAMLYENLAGILRGCRAATKLVILDCCHAELGNKANYQFQSADLTEAYPVDGLYFIGASRTHQKAKFPLSGDLTYFTEAFIDVVRGGIQGLPPELRLDQIFLEVRSRLVTEGLPEPVDSGTRGARQYPFALNAAGRAAPPVSSADPARLARLRIFDHAERAAAEVMPYWRRGDLDQAVILLEIAAAVRADDPVRARQLAGRATRLARGATAQPSDMSKLAGAMVAVDARRAESIATAITDPGYRAHALAEIAKAIAGGDPAGAERVAAVIGIPGTRNAALAEVARIVAAAVPEEAERIALTIGEWGPQAVALTHVAKAVAATDPAHAERIAGVMAGYDSDYSLASIVELLAESDPDAAERVTELIAEPEQRDRGLAAVAAGLAADPGRAAKVLAEIADPDERGWAAYVTARTLGRTDLDAAEKLAEAIPQPLYRCMALRRLAANLAETDSGRIRLLDAAERIRPSIADRVERDKLAGQIAGMLAAAEPDRAQRMARSLTDPDAQAEVIALVAIRTAATNSDEAKRIALTITVPYRLPMTLMQAAGVAAARGDDYGARALLDEAERRCRTVVSLDDRASLLASLAVRLAASDPAWAWRVLDEAEIVAATIPEPPGLNYVMPSDKKREQIVRKVVSWRDAQAFRVLRDHAERIARAIPGPRQQADALTAFAEKVFPDDSDRAERATLAIRFPDYRIRALLKLAAMHPVSRLPDS